MDVWMDVHTQPWLCKQETNRVAHAEPPTQDVKYRHFSRVYTEHSVSQLVLVHDLVCYSRKFEGALKGGVYSVKFFW